MIELEIVAVRCPECKEMVSAGDTHACWQLSPEESAYSKAYDALLLAMLSGSDAEEEIQALERLDQFLDGDREDSDADD